MSQQQQQQQSSAPTAAPAPAALGLGDAVSIIVGIVVGAGIYQTAPFIFKHVPTPQMAMAAWAVAGVLSFIGALCYAELATTYPRDGGDIVYLNRAFGRWCGFLFGWVQLTTILTGSIGMMAFVFANYAIRLVAVLTATEELPKGVQLGEISAFGFAGGAILLLTVTNVLGVVFGKLVQNVLTLAKVIGLGAIITAGFMAPHAGAWQETSLPLDELRKLTFPGFEASIGVAMVLILYTYGGWNDAAFVAAEVKNAKRNMTLALILGLLLITLLYMLVNFAYINALGYREAQSSRQIAADVLNRGFGSNGVALMCVLVMVSSLGAVNGLIFTGARVYAKIGQDHRVLSWMGGWSVGKGAPIPALATQGLLALALVFLVGTEPGRKGINAVLELTQVLKPMEWEDSWKASLDTGAGEKATDLAKGGFDTLLTCTAPIFWGFFLLTGISLFVLRERDANRERPFKVPFYPTLPLIFCVTCGYMLYSSIAYAFVRDWKGGLVLLGVLPLLIGLPLYHVSQAMGDAKQSEAM